MVSLSAYSEEFLKYIGPFSFVNIYVSSIDIKESKSSIDFGLANLTDISCAAWCVPISSIFKFVSFFPIAVHLGN